MNIIITDMRIELSQAINIVTNTISDLVGISKTVYNRIYQDIRQNGVFGCSKRHQKRINNRIDSVMAPHRATV